MIPQAAPEVPYKSKHLTQLGHEEIWLSAKSKSTYLASVYWMADWDLILFYLKIWNEKGIEISFSRQIGFIFAESKGSTTFFSHFRCYSRCLFKSNQRLLLLHTTSVFLKLWVINHQTTQKIWNCVIVVFLI